MKKQSKQDNGEATLISSSTSIYKQVYRDNGSGATMDVTIWRPIPDPGFFILGDYAQGDYVDAAQGQAITVKAINDDPDNPLIKVTTTCSLVWNDHGSKGPDGSIWLPTAPPGYVAVGCVGTYGYTAPPLETYACLRQDQLERTQVGALIWKDRKSGAKLDVSLYSVVDVANTFVGQGNYQPYARNVYRLRIS